MPRHYHDDYDNRQRRPFLYNFDAFELAVGGLLLATTAVLIGAAGRYIGRINHNHQPDISNTPITAPHAAPVQAKAPVQPKAPPVQLCAATDSSNVLINGKETTIHHDHKAWTATLTTPVTGYSNLLKQTVPANGYISQKSYLADFAAGKLCVNEDAYAHAYYHQNGRWKSRYVDAGSSGTSCQNFNEVAKDPAELQILKTLENSITAACPHRFAHRAPTPQ